MAEKKTLGNWFGDTFSSESSEDDLIQSRSLNITRIAAVIVPLLTAIGAAIADLAKTEPWSDPAFQQKLFFVMVGFVALVTVADILGRAIASAAASRAMPAAATLLPTPFAAEKEIATGPDLPGKIYAFRTLNAEAKTAEGEYLFISKDGTVHEWLNASSVHLAPP